MIKIGGPNLGPIGLNQAQNEVFHNFLEFGSLVFHKIAYNVAYFIFLFIQFIILSP